MSGKYSTETRRRDLGTRARRPALMCVALLGLLPAHGQVRVERDPQADPRQCATYGLHASATELSASTPLEHAAALQVLRHRLDHVGLREVEAPDCWFVYHAVEERHGVVSSARLGGLGAIGPAETERVRAADGWTTIVAEYAVGTVVVDVFDAARRRLIWRGSLAGAVSPGPVQRKRQLDKNIRRVARKWEKEYRRAAR